ncbi:MAG TPA: hypothetical protein VFN68_16540 [Acidimicrobiales bacterium]|nr:hypothetical protein [Acidimicrobiales bacterium]
MDRWCRLVVRSADGSTSAESDLTGSGRPDMEAVDAVARAALQAVRAGQRLIIADAVPELVGLLDLAGLGGVVEVERQPERGEQALSIEMVQEEGHLGDLPS